MIKKRRKKKTLTFHRETSIFDYSLQQFLLHQTNESYDNVNTLQRNAWRRQLTQLDAFKTSLNWRNSFTFDSDSFPIVYDSGASSTSTFNKSDFVPGTFKPLSGVVVSGIASGLAV